MNAAETDTEVGTIEHLDFEPDLVCEIPAGCDRAAVVNVRTKCCGKACLYCDAHLRKLLELTAGARVVKCIRCCKTGGSLEEIADIIRLGGAS